MAELATTRIKKFLINTFWATVGFFDYLNTSAIYTGYLSPTLVQLYAQSLQFIFFPFYAINAAIYAVLALSYLLVDRDKETNKLKTEHLIRFAINTLSLCIVTAAVLGTLVFSAAMGVATTLLFACNLALTGIYNFSGAAYHFYQYRKKGKQLELLNPFDPDAIRINKERAAHRVSGINYLVVGITIALVALAGGLAALGGFLPLAGIGIAAGILGAGFCALGLYSAISREMEKRKKDQQVDDRKKNEDQIELLPKNLQSTPHILKKFSSEVTRTFGQSFYAIDNKVTSTIGQPFYAVDDDETPTPPPSKSGNGEPWLPGASLNSEPLRLQ